MNYLLAVMFIVSYMGLGIVFQEYQVITKPAGWAFFGAVHGMLVMTCLFWGFVSYD